MGSSSHRKSGSSARSTSRKRVVIGAEDTSKVRYKKKERAKVEPLRRHPTRGPSEQHARLEGEAGRRVSKTKRDERERRKAGIERRRVLVGLAAGLAAVLFVVGLIALARAPIFPVRSVVVTGEHRITAESILAVAAVPSDTTLLRIDAKRIEGRLSAESWIASAKVVRHFPGTIELRITERIPAAIVDAGGTKLWLVDGQAVWLATATSEQTATLPSIRDVENLVPKAGVQSPSLELRNALQVWQGLSLPMRAMVRTISAPTIDRTVLILPRGVQVFVGSSEDIAKKDEVARTILAQHKNVVYVNVRVLRATTYRSLNTPN